MKVGFFGLGRMGSGMAGQILGAGHELKAYDVIPVATAALAKKGAEVASSVAEACKGSEVVISMLTSDEILESVTTSDEGIRDSLDAGAIHLVMGTHGVKVVHVLDEVHKESDQILVAAPVLGRPDLAATGQLGIVPAGPAEAVAKCKPLFDAMGKGTFDAGLRPEAANAIKLTNNFVLGCAIEAMAEAFSLVRKYDVKPEVMFEVMTGGLFAAPAYQVYGKIMVDKSWDAPGFPIDQLEIKLFDELEITVDAVENRIDEHCLTAHAAAEKVGVSAGGVVEKLAKDQDTTSRILRGDRNRFAGPEYRGLPTRLLASARS